MYVLALLVLVGGPLLLGVIALAAKSATRGGADIRREWTYVRVTWVAALVVGCVAAWLVQGSLDLGRGTMLVPAVVGLSVVVGVGLAETVVRPRRPTGPRSASLAARRVVDYVPQALTTGVVAITAVHLATLALTTMSASTDEAGRAGRQVAARCGNVANAAGPYPGSFYSVPLVLLLLVIGLAAGAALVAVVRRPRGLGPDDVGDDALRVLSATRVVAAAGAAVAASHAGVAFFAGTALLRMDCQRAWMDPAGWVLVATIPAALLMLGWFVGRILVPGALPAPSPAHPAEAR